jgi:hypothetical protein
MEISQAGVRANLSAQRELWNLVKARRVSQAERKEGQAFVEERLGSLLIGQQLNQAQQGDYVRRLAGTAALAARLGQGPMVPDLALARIPRDRLLFKAGGVAWRPFPISQKTVRVTPLQRRLQDRLALALKNKVAGAPESARTCVHAVGITVDRGYFTTTWNDEDRVELTGWGMEMLVLEKQLSSAPVLPEPRFLFATLAPTSAGVIAASNR